MNDRIVSHEPYLCIMAVSDPNSSEIRARQIFGFTYADADAALGSTADGQAHSGEIDTDRDESEPAKLCRCGAFGQAMIAPDKANSPIQPDELISASSSTGFIQTGTGDLEKVTFEVCKSVCRFGNSEFTIRETMDGV